LIDERASIYNLAVAEFIEVGRIVNTHGLKGQVKVEVLTDFDQRLAKGRRLRLKNDWVTVEASAWQGSRMLMKLSGVNDIDHAKSLQWEYLSAPAEEELELDDDEYVVEDLIDLEVYTSDGEKLGKVDAVEPYPAQDILMVGELMIPFAQQFVKDIDFDKRRITVELLEGMRDPEP